MGELKERMLRRMELKNFSQRTIKIYLYHMERFVAYYGKPPGLLGKDEIEGYLYHLIKQKASTSGVTQAYSALKYFYSNLLGKAWLLEKIPRPKVEKKLPVVLSKEEVKAILQSVSNYKHKTILMLIYSSGVRILEAVSLKIKNIDSSRMQIMVEQGKGKKDRYTLLSTVLLQRLREYYKIYRPTLWLFPGKAGKHLCPSTVQKAFGNAKKKLVLQKMQQYTRCAIVLPHTF